jgi:peroxiredoxin 2/4
LESREDNKAGYAHRPLQIGDMAPDFHARTTTGEITLSDRRGRWVLLFSHPADFTPVCTSEFIALSRAGDRFAALNCDLVALSVDSLYSHLGWIRAIREHFGVTIGFPIVEDPSLVIGRAYGMIAADAPDAATLRYCFFIDAEGVIRATLCYPATVGRCVEELLRVLAALQRVDRDNVVTPEGWHPGDDVLLPPSSDQGAALDSAGDDCWFHRTRADNPGTPAP